MIDSAGERRRNRADARPDQPRGEKLHEPGANDDREKPGRPPATQRARIPAGVRRGIPIAARRVGHLGHAPLFPQLRYGFLFAEGAVLQAQFLQICPCLAHLWPRLQP